MAYEKAHFRWIAVALVIAVAVVFFSVVSLQDHRDIARRRSREWFKQAKLGLMVHWGPISRLGKEISWSRGGDRLIEEGRGDVPVEVYDSLYRSFHPTEFDAEEWAATFKRSGAQYVTLVAKHHDGFCMFDSALTDYDIMNTPIGRDLTAELVSACRRAGLGIGIYYSQPDWHHPDYRNERHDRYLAYMYGQIRELLTNYGRIDILWFDGLEAGANMWRTDELFAMIRALQPGILINDRAGAPGDFVTHEETIEEDKPGELAEVCHPLGEQWSWAPDDRYKSPDECIRLLAECGTIGANLALGLGPMPSGRLDPRQVAVLNALGSRLLGARGTPVPFNPNTAVR